MRDSRLFIAAASLALALPAASGSAEVVHGVEVLLPPGYEADPERPPAVEPSGEQAPGEDASPATQVEPRIVVTAAPPPVPGWERPPEVVVTGLRGPGEIVVYSPAPEPMPAARKLDGVDIRTHRIAEVAPTGRVATQGFAAGAASRIRYHDARSAEAARIPTAGSGGARMAQSWNPQGPRYEPSRIRYHGWSRAGGDTR